jgi:hypothetical protein
LERRLLNRRLQESAWSLKGRSTVVTFIMVGVVAVIALLCLSSAFPEMKRGK